MTHYEFIISNFNIVAHDNESQSVLFIAYGELCCEINGQSFSCSSVEEFWEMVEFFKDETFEEQPQNHLTFPV